jgi:hypothetical protein
MDKETYIGLSIERMERAEELLDEIRIIPPIFRIKL